jgi:hypothetical protein
MNFSAQTCATPQDNSEDAMITTDQAWVVKPAGCANRFKSGANAKSRANFGNHLQKSKLSSATGAGSSARLRRSTSASTGSSSAGSSAGSPARHQDPDPDPQRSEQLRLIHEAKEANDLAHVRMLLAQMELLLE